MWKTLKKKKKKRPLTNPILLKPMKVNFGFIRTHYLHQLIRHRRPFMVFLLSTLIGLSILSFLWMFLISDSVSCPPGSFPKGRVIYSHNLPLCHTRLPIVWDPLGSKEHPVLIININDTTKRYQRSLFSFRCTINLGSRRWRISALETVWWMERLGTKGVDNCNYHYGESVHVRRRIYSIVLPFVNRNTGVETSLNYFYLKEGWK